jgi:DNA-binding transcriptional LysR family regulator
VTYDQLIAFLAVASHGSFTAASAALHKSQPAVSKLVRNLEDEIGVELFDRSEYRASLTGYGKLLRERAGSVIESTEALKTFAASLAGRVEAVVRLAVEAVTPLAPVLESLRSLQELHPNVRFELSTESVTGAAESLDAERADIAIASMAGLGATSIESVRWGRVPIVPVARTDHPLALAQPAIERALFRRHAQIVLRDSATSGDSPSINVLEGGLRWYVSDVAAKLEIILGGMGWGGLPGHVVAEHLRRGNLVRLDVPEFSTEAIDLFVHRRRDRARGPVAEALWESLVVAARAPAQKGP